MNIIGIQAPRPLMSFNFRYGDHVALRTSKYGATVTARRNNSTDVVLTIEGQVVLPADIAEVISFLEQVAAALTPTTNTIEFPED